MYTGRFIQTDNSCAAATLMIALHEKDIKNSVDSYQEKALYAQTKEQYDLRLTKHGYSSPQNILATAKKEGFRPTLYKTDDIALNALDEGQAEQLRDFVDSQHPQVVKPADLLPLLDSGPLQILVYIGGDQDRKHWLLLRKNGSSYYLYDTALGINARIEHPETLLLFNDSFFVDKYLQKKDYAFLGIAIHLRA